MNKSYITILLLFLLFTNSFEILTWPFKVQEPDEYEDQDAFPFIDEKSSIRSLLEIPSVGENQFRTTVNMCLGTPPQCFDLEIQTNSFYIWVSDAEYKIQNSKNKFDRTKSTTLVRNMTKIEVIYSGNNIKGTQAKDILSIDYKGSRLDLSRVNFLMVQQSEHFRHIDGMIGLGYTPKSHERKFSIIQQLFENGVIAHKVFSQKFDEKDPTKGLLTIGEIPKYIVDDYVHYGRCNALNKEKDGKKYRNKSWQCYIDELYFENSDVNNQNKLIMNNVKVTFLSYRKRTFVPRTIFEALANKFLKNYIESGQCGKVTHKHFTLYECNKDIQLPNLILKFGPWELKISSDKLFEENKENVSKKLFIFTQNPRRDKFILGRNILNDVEMVYDYANKEIGFYNKEVKYVGKTEITKPKVYEFLKDDDEYKTRKVQSLNPVKPNLKSNDLAIEENKGIVERNDSDGFLTLPNLIKKILGFFIILVGIGILGFLILYAIRFNQKKKMRELNKQLGTKFITSSTVEA